jgi:hypothetical protein
MARPTSKVTNVKVQGPLAPFAAAYKSRLEESGYTPLTIVNELRQVAHLSRWRETSEATAPPSATTARFARRARP